MVSDLPSFVPRFGEISKINYEYKAVNWKQLDKRSKKGLLSPTQQLGLYENPPTKEMYNDFPDE